jgi:hypothetical protein
MKEIWKDIKGYERLYQVSNMGRVKSLARFQKAKENSISYRKEKFLKISTRKKDGYLVCWLYKNGIRKTYLIHILVAKEFILNPENKPQVNHKDGIKSHCYESNLEWMTRSENEKHAWKIGLQKMTPERTLNLCKAQTNKHHGELNGQTKLKEFQVRRIKFIAKYYKPEHGYWSKLAKSLHITMQCINQITKNKNWKRVEV